MKAHIVIGANFGDEGKGRVTDYLSNLLDNPIVIRFNGGAQAGHTVTRAGKRHVFSHFGSGTMLDVPTYLSKYFVVNPFLYVKESELLKEFQPMLMVDPRCMVTTPWDMIYNQSLENHRNQKRHGSCGVGVNETITRNEFIPTTYGYLYKHIDAACERIKQYYLLKYDTNGIEVPEVFESPEMEDDFKRFYQKMLDECFILDETILKTKENLIFEGAQGLLLDEDHSWFPHVTRSKTGLANPMKIMKSIGLTEADVYYVTRPYLTRHGAGPLPFEDSSMRFEDLTNKPHKFQGTLRFAPFNWDLFKRTIEEDVKDILLKMRINVNAVITCMDQVTDDIKVVMNPDCYPGSFTKRELILLFRTMKMFDNIFCSESQEGALSKIC